MSERFVVYGTGHSAGLIARRAVAHGLEPVVCGRNAMKVGALAEALGVEGRVASVLDPAMLDRAFAGAAVVLNAAGPFCDTADAVAAACMRTRAHYVDITAEVPVIEALAARHADAARAGVMLMPGVGFDVVPTDCLAVHVARRVGRPRKIAIAVSGLAYITRGSAKTLIRSVDGGLLRRDGALMPVALGSIERTFDFGVGVGRALNVSLGDLATAHYSTGAGDLETYVQATPLVRALLAGARTFGPIARTAPWQAVLAALADLLPADPVNGHGEGPRMVVVAEAEDGRGNRAAARLHTPHAYPFTAVTAVEIVRRAMSGDVELGFQTPGRVYGGDFVMAFGDVQREEVA